MSLRGENTEAQRRVDAAHPLDLYADFQQPDRPGLVILCNTRPPDVPSLKSIEIERRQRSDGRWSLRILLDEPRLLPVFAELCRDIINFTRSGIDQAHAGAAVISRIERWRTLMQMQQGGLNPSELKGLIGELLVLEKQLLPLLGPDAAAQSWTGPLGADQDFRLPTGLKIEVKALDRDADRVRINGLGQLDGGKDLLELAVVRLEDTGRDAENAITASRLIARLRKCLVDAPGAIKAFNTLLGFVGWDDGADPDDVVVRLVRIDRYEVTADFPRLTFATVPVGVADASYVIILPSLVMVP